MFGLAQEKASHKKELRKLLNELLDLDSLFTQKDCLHMYYQLMGIERFLASDPDDVNMKSLLKQLEEGKKAIVEKRWELCIYCNSIQ